MSQGRPSQSDLLRWRDVATGICDEADAMAMAGFRRDVKVSTKPDRSLVTEVDQAIEHMARARLRSEFPGCGIVGEEEGTEAAGARLCWYVDPIDGTHNYVRGVPVFATLLALSCEGELQLGMVSAPGLHERWMAWRGGGAWRGSERISVSAVAAIEDSQLEDMQSGEMPGLDATLAEAWRERGFGDFWGYMLVAEGAAEAMMETGAHPWDWAAPLVIVEEAGGRFTTVSGKRTIEGASAVATNGAIHEELLLRLGRIQPRQARPSTGGNDDAQRKR